MKHLVFLMASVGLVAQTPYLNPDLPAEQRAKGLVSRMTLAKKFCRCRLSLRQSPVLAVHWRRTLQRSVGPQSSKLGMAAKKSERRSRKLWPERTIPQGDFL